MVHTESTAFAEVIEAGVEVVDVEVDGEYACRGLLYLVLQGNVKRLTVCLHFSFFIVYYSKVKSSSFLAQHLHLLRTQAALEWQQLGLQLPRGLGLWLLVTL